MPVGSRTYLNLCKPANPKLENALRALHAAGYGQTHGQLATFLTKHFPPLASSAETDKAASLKAPNASNQARLLRNNNRAFLLKDCGQMTIEGLRAEMDTAQRKFDLERLFVPLQVLPSPPEIPQSDPQRDSKLLEWQEKHKKPAPFGKVLANQNRLALLALPGTLKPGWLASGRMESDPDTNRIAGTHPPIRKR
ncbi:MAG TPA: hypothetical protein VHU83_07310 [Bryobacteraceae bacterium]|jgi:hypothetical protein|nr:hypothetical protein [Bryobacteraceae bacterium]